MTALEISAPINTEGTRSSGSPCAWLRCATVHCTAAANGTDGTDHGTGTLALVLGGAVKGGRVITDWPGLAPAALFEGRDLKPTRDVRTVLKGVLRDHLGVPAGHLANTVFPDSGAVLPLDGLLA